MGDINSDGAADVVLDKVVSNGSGITCSINTYLSNKDGTFGGKNETVDQWANGLMQLGDINGDGFPDLLVNKPQVVAVSPYNCPIPPGMVYYKIWAVIYLSNGDDGTFTYSEKIPTSGTACSCGFPQTVPIVFYLADINGDGLSDLIDTDKTNSNIHFYFSDGSGSFQGNEAIPVGGINGSGMFLADVNGDRLVDINTEDTATGSVYTYLSRGDGTFREAQVNNGPGGGIKTGDIILADINGDGLADLNKLSSDGDVYSYLANSDGVADLLKTTENGTGGTTTIIYEPSSSYLQNNIPYVIQTVSAISVDDGLGNKITNAYSYSGAKHSYAKREFLGFETATSTNPDGTTVRTWFHQEPYKKGRQEFIEMRKAASEGGDLLSKSIFTWETYPVNPDGDQWQGNRK